MPSVPAEFSYPHPCVCLAPPVLLVPQDCSTEHPLLEKPPEACSGASADGGSALSSPWESLCWTVHFVGCQGLRGGAPHGFAFEPTTSTSLSPASRAPGWANQKAATWGRPPREKWAGLLECRSHQQAAGLPSRAPPSPEGCGRPPIAPLSRGGQAERWWVCGHRLGTPAGDTGLGHRLRTPSEPCPSQLPPAAMSDYENEGECWSALEGFRVKLVSVIDPSRITPYLRQCKVLNPDDEEQVLSDPNLVIRKRKVGVLLDILQRTGHKGYVAFLESLELYYPQLYKKVTGKEPARVFSTIIDASGESGLTQLLMSEVMKLQKKVQDLTALLSSKDDFIKELRVKDSLLRKHQERVQRLKEECEACGRELKRCKDENYDLAMRLARQSEEKGAALMRNRDLQLEVDRLRHSLMKAEDDCKVERKHTLKLRHAMEQRPSQELLWELQQEKALLQARVQELEASAQEGKPDESSPYVQVPEEDWQQVLRDHQEQAHTIFALRKDLRQGEALRARCMEEKEVFELQCLALRKDSKMYKERTEAILQQMEEVAAERDQAIASREELHAQCARSLQDKDSLRKRVRELSEKADELQLQLFQREGELLAAEGRLRRRQLEALALTSDLEDSSPRNSQELSLPRDLEEDAQLSDRGIPADEESSEQPFAALQEEPLSLTPSDAGLRGGEPHEKERRRLKESFENYRRKRALRKMQHGSRQGEVDWENTTGSDNTDTEGS